MQGMEILGWIWICGKIIRLFTTLERFYERNYSNMTGIQKNILKYLFKFLPCKALILAIDYAMTMTPKIRRNSQRPENPQQHTNIATITRLGK